jgi:hypothetical protein
MLPEVQEFFATQDGSDESYMEQDRIARENPVPMWRETWTAEERAAFYEAEEKREMAQLKARQARRERRAASIDVLKNSSDPVVKWLVTDRVIQRDYVSYRDAVLRALPMTREEIDSFGDRQGWCGDYARMLDRAEKAGNVLPEPTPDLANIEPLIRVLRNHFGGSPQSYKNIIKAQLPALLASAKEYAEKAEAEAQAKIEAEAKASAETTPEVDSTPADVQPRRRAVPVRNPDGTFAGSVTVAA